LGLAERAKLKQELVATRTDIASHLTAKELMVSKVT
jgi:hypothetical protein